MKWWLVIVLAEIVFAAVPNAPPDACIVKDSSIEQKYKDVTFWGNIRDDGSSTLKFYGRTSDNDKEEMFLKLGLNQTHRNVFEKASMGNKMSEILEVDDVVPGWRQFHLVTSQQDIITLTDHYGTIWMNISIQHTINRIEVDFQYFSTSCYSVTPTRFVNSPAGSEFSIASDQTELQVTLVGAGEDFLPVVMLPTGNITLTWDHHNNTLVPHTSTPVPDNPLPADQTHLLFFTRKSSGVEVSGLSGDSVEVEGTDLSPLKFTKNGTGNFYVIQHLHLNHRTSVTECVHHQGQWWELLEVWGTVGGVALFGCVVAISVSVGCYFSGRKSRPKRSFIRVAASASEVNYCEALYLQPLPSRPINPPPSRPAPDWPPSEDIYEEIDVNAIALSVINNSNINTDSDDNRSSSTIPSEDIYEEMNENAMATSVMREDNTTTTTTNNNNNNTDSDDSETMAEAKL